MLQYLKRKQDGLKFEKSKNKDYDKFKKKDNKTKKLIRYWNQ